MILPYVTAFYSLVLEVTLVVVVVSEVVLVVKVVPEVVLVMDVVLKVVGEAVVTVVTVFVVVFVVAMETNTLYEYSSFNCSQIEWIGLSSLDSSLQKTHLMVTSNLSLA